ncbi:hypothetical protein F2Q69_00015613 [Brassica cretica]|uniref:Uncharacterized protein n=1 Tax=Brassica cretica TaxID=69181 RepID=A0A8S9R464_BRACR|nr:hypothetical protein F2Q69_00015613 [Brassica cretica]
MTLISPELGTILSTLLSNSQHQIATTRKEKATLMKSRESPHRRNYKAQTNSWQERSGHRRSYLARERSGQGSDRPPRGREYSSHRQPPAPPSRSFYREVPKHPPMLKDTDSTASKSYPENADRGIPQQNIGDSLPQVSLQEAVGEVRDAMKQYSQCADPTEREARKELLRQTEERGEFEEAASLMVRASLTANTANQIDPTANATPERTPASQRLGPSPNSQAKGTDPNPRESNSNPRERLPATQRLGPPPITHSHRDVDRDERVPVVMRLGQGSSTAGTKNDAIALCATKRKPGRPPGSRLAPEKQTIPASPVPKKRRVSQPKPSPARRKSNAAKTTKRSDARAPRPLVQLPYTCINSSLGYLVIQPLSQLSELVHLAQGADTLFSELH